MCLYYVIFYNSTDVSDDPETKKRRQDLIRREEAQFRLDKPRRAKINNRKHQRNCDWYIGYFFPVEYVSC